MGLIEYAYEKGKEQGERTAIATAAAANDAIAVNELRTKMYKLKNEMIRTPMLRDILKSIFETPACPPRSIILNAAQIIARVYDSESRTYHPNGVPVYEPDAAFDYIFGCALFSLIQDMYPGVYDFPVKTAAEVSEDISSGRWCLALTMKDDYCNKTVTPAFDPDKLASMPESELPIETVDPRIAKMKKVSQASLILGIVAFVAELIGFAVFFIGVLGGLCGVAGFVTGLMSLLSGGTKSKSLIGLILSALAIFVLPVLQMIFAISNFLSF